jgi:phospholipid-binding lipoprotein MlaA
MNPARAIGSGPAVRGAHAACRPLRGVVALALAFSLLAGGCATTAGGGAAGEPSAHEQRLATVTQANDPWERWNRKVFAFNDALDEAVLIPVATAYRDTVPAPVRTGVGNFFGNLRDVWSTANHLLQGKVGSGAEMGMRVLVNTFFGLGGILDPATEFGLTRRSEDLGQTLAVWGVANGPYVVLPLFGPSTVRDTVGFIGDRQVGITAADFFNRAAESYSVTAFEVIHTRAGLLGTTGLIGQVALDRYTLTRDGYLARRRDQIFDGNPPMESFDDGGFEDWDDEEASPAPDGAGEPEAGPQPQPSQPGTGAAIPD